jgi:hypothetical protein
VKINLVGAKGGVGTSVLTVALAMHFDASAYGPSLRAVQDHRAIAALPPPEVDEVITSFGDGSHRFRDAGTDMHLPDANVWPWRNVLVVDNSYLALRTVRLAATQFDGLIVMMRPQRALLLADVRDVLPTVPLVGTVDESVEMARCIDAGLLRTRLPRLFARQLDQIATALTNLDAGVTL